MLMIWAPDHDNVNHKCYPIILNNASGLITLTIICSASASCKHSGRNNIIIIHS